MIELRRKSVLQKDGKRKIILGCAFHSFRDRGKAGILLEDGDADQTVMSLFCRIVYSDSGEVLSTSRDSRSIGF